jgi:hypothetical protein
MVNPDFVKLEAMNIKAWEARNPRDVELLCGLNHKGPADYQHFY